MLKSNFLVFVLALFIISCGTFTSYNSSFSPQDRIIDTKPGKCYAKGLIPGKFEYEYITIPNYTGTDFNNPYIKEESFEIEAPYTHWVKIKPDQNCRAPKPDDCLVWCLKEEPGKYLDRYVVTDTIMMKEFQLEEIELKIRISSYYTDWIEVVCEYNITDELLNRLAYALTENGYEIVYSPEIGFDQDFKRVLTEFQQDNELGIGGISKETLDLLEIEY